MRYVTKKKEDRTVLLSCDETYQELLNIIKTKNKNLITEKIYREAYDTPDGRRSKVEDQLALSYKNKCAYCERICKADIEHYRPKKAVEDDPTHSGYYWLCYEWTNLIPSCINCNREGGKHSKFPIIGARVNTPSMKGDDLDLDTCHAYNNPLLNERPYLLHPEVDRPEHFFKFAIDPKGEGIRLVGIDVEGRGTRTIEICLLNRQEIKLDRVRCVIDEFKDSIHCLFLELLNNKIDHTQFVGDVILQLKTLEHKSRQEEKTHTYLRKYVVASLNNFESIVLPFLNVEVRKIVLEAFKASYL